MNRKLINRAAQLLIDIVVLSMAYWLAFLFRFEFEPTWEFIKLLFFTWPYVVILQYVSLVAFGVPTFAWRYTGIRESYFILGGVGVATAILGILRVSLAGMGGYTRYAMIPLGVIAMDFVLAFLGIIGIRILWRVYSDRIARSKRQDPRIEKVPTLLVGAGQAGVMVAKEIAQRPDLGIEPVGFLDDDKTKHGMVVHGVKVLGGTERIPELKERYDVAQVILTMANAPGSAVRRIRGLCDEVGLPAKIIPGIYEIVGGKVNLSRIRDVSIEDLLGREVVELDLEGIKRFLSGKRVLVTGAGGSIGSEICRQVSAFGPERLILFERFETALFHIHNELRDIAPEITVIPAIGDVTDEARVDAVFGEHAPEVVFHAAAHKHVPMMEYNPGEAIKNNVVGTRTIATKAASSGCEAFVLISTDKAVNPTSIMGATKRIAEMMIQSLSGRSETKLIAVRFGNVLGSAGSVIPTFKAQIARGGPVTVTHEEMRRYFMTIPEATQLVMQAASMGRGGEIFVLDMGEPIYIRDLARDLIKLSGLEPGEDIPIEYTGMRPGEKLFEELGFDAEKMDKTRHPKIFVGKLAPTSWDMLAARLAPLEALTDARHDRAAIRKALKAVVPEMILEDHEASPASAP